MNLGTALAALARHEGGPMHLEEAVVAFRLALDERTRERVPVDWAMAQLNLGNALMELGEGEEGTERLEEAVAVLRGALEVFQAADASFYAEPAEASLRRAERVLRQRQGDR